MTNIKIFSKHNFLICGNDNFEDEVCDFCYVDIFLENNEKCYLKFFPLDQNNFSIPFCLCIKQNNNMVECDAKNIKIYKVLSHYEIFVEPYIINIKNFCTSKTIQLAKTNCKINVWENNIEFLTSQYCHTENITISNPVFDNIGGCAIVYGKHKTSNACVIFCPNTKKCKTVLFEQIELDNKTVKLLYDLQTFPGHKVLKTYSLSETKFELQNFELYCAPDKSRKNPPNEIIPFLFLECIRAKDFCFAKKFVCESLENTSAASFEKYFGEFEHINLHSITPLTYVLYSSSNANVFEFVLQNDKITEINKV